MELKKCLKILPVSVLNAFYYESLKQFEHEESDDILAIMESVEIEIRERDTCLKNTK
ncbi:hypothetical protein ACIQXQ_20180 [Peribacillus sp. NPDC097198]|uniref:hypothetical protein n=1 Tax=Peribacillus sp. NPDC097198 TaxID=3364397 RepID=UPI003821A01F